MKTKQSLVCGLFSTFFTVIFALLLAGCDDSTSNDNDNTNQTPTADDFYIGNLNQTEGSVTAVTVTPKEGKSSGAITIFYHESTTLPLAVGAYPVTFNVAAATGWNAANGLSAGTLAIESELSEINWNNEANGTLTITNNVSNDMIIFMGLTPSFNNILGGVRGESTTKTFDISDDVYDFNAGGYMILRGMSNDEYNAHKENLSQAKIEYSAMATYGADKKFKTVINPSYTGDYAYRVTNLGRIGMELRKDSPDGEKIGYLPALSSNMLLYADSADGFTVYPVYVYYSRTTDQVTTLKPTTQFETTNVSPQLATGGQILAYTFPADQGTTWESIKATLSSPVAYVTVTNNVANQGARVAISGAGYSLKSQNGYDLIGSTETLTYEIASTDGGTAQNVVLTYYNQALQIPVRFTDENTPPVLKNGYDYTVTISGSGQTPDGYTVTIVEGAKRDLSSEIESL